MWLKRTLLWMIIAVVVSEVTNAQELLATVIVNTQRVNQTNKKVFKTLQSSIRDFLNFTKWTDKDYKEHEKIRCRFLINVSSYENNVFVASLQVQSQRPVYNSTYYTTIININDPNFTFIYNEFEPLRENIEIFRSNLISVMSYYAYLVLATDADTFGVRRGTEYINKAKIIVDVASTSNYKGWQQDSNAFSRWNLTDDLYNFIEYRVAMYNYHFNALDKMTNSEYIAKQNVINSVRILKKALTRRSKSFLLPSFFDSKHNEIVQIFSGKQQIPVKDFVEMLNTLAPQYSSDWEKISN